MTVYSNSSSGNRTAGRKILYLTSKSCWDATLFVRRLPLGSAWQRLNAKCRKCHTRIYSRKIFSVRTAIQFYFSYLFSFFFYLVELATGSKTSTNVTYWPSAELSNKRCTCVNNRCIRLKISEYNLNCGRVELDADVTPTRSWCISSNYITRCHKQFKLVRASYLKIRCCSENQHPVEGYGPLGPTIEQLSRTRKKWR